MEVTSFAAINKFQPFNVAVSSNVLFLLVSDQSHFAWSSSTSGEKDLTGLGGGTEELGI